LLGAANRQIILKTTLTERVMQKNDQGAEKQNIASSSFGDGVLQGVFEVLLECILQVFCNISL
jgi:hypothetical protein